MLKLSNIKKKGTIISADVVTVETQPQKFRCSIDVKTQQTLEPILNTYNQYVNMAAGKLYMLYMEYGNKLPSYSECVWF